MRYAEVRSSTDHVANLAHLLICYREMKKTATRMARGKKPIHRNSQRLVNAGWLACLSYKIFGRRNSRGVSSRVLKSPSAAKPVLVTPGDGGNGKLKKSQRDCMLSNGSHSKVGS